MHRLTTYVSLLMFCSVQIFRHCLAYTYAPLLQNALDDFRARWNSHRMRPNKKAGCPTGVPDDLYNLPHLTGRHTVV